MRSWKSMRRLVGSGALPARVGSLLRGARPLRPRGLTHVACEQRYAAAALPLPARAAATLPPWRCSGPGSEGFHASQPAVIASRDWGFAESSSYTAPQATGATNLLHLLTSDAEDAAEGYSLSSTKKKRKTKMNKHKARKRRKRDRYKRDK